VGVGGDATKDGVGGVKEQRVLGRASSKQAAGEAVGQGGFADALRAGDQPGVVQPLCADGVQIVVSASW